MRQGWGEPTGPRLLVVDPDARLAELLRRAMCATDPGLAVASVSALRAALEALRARATRGVVTELRLVDADGPRIVRELRAVRPDVPIVVATGAGSEELAVAAMRLGAADYVSKHSARMSQLAAVVREALGRAVVADLEEVAAPPAALVHVTADAEPFVAGTASMRHVLALLDRASRSAVPVLLEGETGTGKELLARAIHQRGSRRAAPFLVQNCAALSESLLESELFGHLRGAFTGADRDRRGLFAEAGDGTLFLDEIAEAPAAVQAKLLRVLQNGEVKPVGADRPSRVRARIVTATNRSLEGEVHAGRFRGDLYYRLAVFPIRIPPLRQRAADVPALLAHSLRRFELEEARSTAGFAPDALRLLQHYAWPGNVRELEHEVHRVVLTVGAGERIGRHHLARRIRETDPSWAAEPLQHLLARVELALIRQRLTEHPTKAAAARSLGITREALYQKLRRLTPKIAAAGS